MTATLPRGNILVVDDTIQNLRLLTEILSGTGCEVRPVTSGPQALEAAAHSPPDLVLLDIGMPEMDGYEVCSRLKALPGFDDMPVLFLTAVTDNAGKVRAFEAGGADHITKPFHAEELLARVHVHLQLRQARQTLSDNLARLQQLERLRDDLVHMIVHDMRGPLTVIKGHLELIEQTPRNKTHLAIADGATDVLLRMTHDLLDVSRMEEGRLALQHTSCDLMVLAEEARATIAAWNRDRPISISAPGRSLASCDGALIVRVLQNLLDNAAKHTPSNTAIEVVIREAPGVIRVEVRDHGPGVPAALREHIFTKFGVASTWREGHARSTGLGLAFCRLVIKAHDGDIGVLDAHPQGSVFWFELPHAPSHTS